LLCLLVPVTIGLKQMEGFLDGFEDIERRMTQHCVLFLRNLWDTSGEIVEHKSDLKLSDFDVTPSL